MNRTIALVAWIFIAVGLVLLGIGGYFAWDTQRFVAGAAHADGVVAELVWSGGRSGRSAAPRVEFTAADGSRVHFQSGITRSPPGYDVGERVAVLYPPQAPESARIDTTFELWFVASLLCGLGGLFAATGSITFAVARHAVRVGQELRRSGRPLQAEFVRLETDWTIRVNNRNAWRIVVRGTDPATGRTAEFRSQRLWTDPTPNLREQFTVFVDSRNSARYLVDVSFLPELAQS